VQVRNKAKNEKPAKYLKLSVAHGCVHFERKSLLKLAENKVIEPRGGRNHRWPGHGQITEDLIH
jgi:hypothetical protein